MLPAEETYLALFNGARCVAADCDGEAPRRERANILTTAARNAFPGALSPVAGEVEVPAGEVCVVAGPIPAALRGPLSGSPTSPKSSSAFGRFWCDFVRGA